MENAERLYRMLPEALREATGPLPEDLAELRVRAGQPVQLVRIGGGSAMGRPVGAELAARTAQALSGYSLYAREEELSEGYFTMDGGMRVGVCGRMRAGKLTHIGSVSVRIPREVFGAADAVMDALYEEGRPVSALIISPPGLGKTTLIRDIARQMSDGTGGRRPVRVAIADERGEIAGCVLGIPTLNVGMRTDVMDGCPKRVSMELMARSMSPQVIITDELGHSGDMEAVRDVMRSGIQVIATVHARDGREAEARFGPEAVLFRRKIVLGGEIGKIQEISGG